MTSIVFNSKSTKLILKAIYLSFFLGIILINTQCAAKNENSSLATLNTEAILARIEGLIIKGKYRAAHEIYSEMNKSKKYLTSSDVNNALFCAISFEDWKNAVVWSELLVSKGIPIEYFDGSHFNNFKKTKEWKSFKANFSKYDAEFNSKKNKELIKALDKLYEIDQQAYCNIPIDNSFLDSAFVMTHSIDSSLVDLFNNYGFPTEEMVGVEFNKETKRLGLMPKYSGLYRHSFQANSKLIDKRLKGAVAKGYLKKSVYEFMTGTKNFQFMEVDCKIYENVEISKTDSINSDRLRKLLLFIKSHKNRDKFLFYVPYSKWEKETISSIPNNVFLKYYNYLGENADCSQN